MDDMSNKTHALLFGLSEDLAGELIPPLTSCAVNIKAIKRQGPTAHNPALAEAPADIIFCGADVSLVSELRSAKPDASIVVVSRYPEVSDWLDSIEAGATDYCAAPFEKSQVKWIVESSLRSNSASLTLA
jgi:ActR/RegA family two-component response regulator